MPSYIKDTSDFINRINKAKDINKDTILVKLNVKSLYNNMKKVWRNRSNKKRIKLCISKVNCHKKYHQIHVLNINTQQFCIQWNSLSAKNRMYYGNKTCTKLRSHFHGKIWKIIHLSMHQFIFKLFLPIYRWYILSLEWNCNTTLTIH